VSGALKSWMRPAGVAKIMSKPLRNRIMTANINTYIEDFIVAKQTEGRSAKTLRLYRHLLKDFAAFLGEGATLKDVTIEQGRAFSLDAVQPPLPFRRRPLVEAALKAWSAARLANAMADLADAVLQSRRNPALADTIAERALLAIAASGRRSAA